MLIFLTWSSLQQKRRQKALPSWLGFSLSSLRRSGIPGLDSRGGGPRHALQNCPICPCASPGEEQGQTFSWSLTSCSQVRDWEVGGGEQTPKKQDWLECGGSLGGRKPLVLTACPGGIPSPPLPSAISTPQTVALGSPAQADATVEALLCPKILLCLECGSGARAGSPGPSALSSPPNREWSFPPFPTNTCFAT